MVWSFGDMKTNAGDVSPSAEPPWFPASFMPWSPHRTKSVEWRCFSISMALYICSTMPSISACFGIMWGLCELVLLVEHDFVWVRRATFVARIYAQYDQGQGNAWSCHSSRSAPALTEYASSRYYLLRWNPGNWFLSVANSTVHFLKE